MKCMGSVNFWAKFVPDSQYPASKRLAVSELFLRIYIFHYELYKFMRIALTGYSTNYTVYNHYEVKETVSYFTLSANCLLATIVVYCGRFSITRQLHLYSRVCFYCDFVEIKNIPKYCSKVP